MIISIENCKNLNGDHMKNITKDILKNKDSFDSKGIFIKYKIPEK